MMTTQTAIEVADRDWVHEPLRTVIEHIVAAYHDPLREDLPRLEMLARQAVQRHGMQAPWLAQVEDIIGELSADLNEHLQKEERVLFPAIRAVEEADYRSRPWLAGPITVMEQEHERAHALFEELRRVTCGYVLPDDAGETLVALYRCLDALESSMDEHTRLEDGVLFPRARAIAGVD